MSNFFINPSWFGGSNLWTPEEIISDVEVWLDLSDSSTVTETSGDISQVDDKSGNSNHYEKTSGTQPQYSGSQNLLNVATFGGSDDEYLRCVNSITFQGISFALDHSSLTANQCVFGGSSAVDAYAALTMGTINQYVQQGGSALFSTKRLNGDNFAVGNSILVNTFLIFYGDYSSSMTRSTDLGEIFNRSGRNFRGKMGEFLAFNTPLSVSDYEKQEGYLAWKWGTESELPIGHPYKDAPPTI